MLRKLTLINEKESFNRRFYEIKKDRKKDLEITPGLFCYEKHHKKVA